MVHGDRELPGGRLRQTPARVGVGLGGQLGLLLARSTHPPGEPLRRQVGLRGAESPGAGPDEDLGAPAGRTPRRRPRRRPGRAGGPARSCGAGGRRTRRPRGGPADPPGSARRDRRRTASAGPDTPRRHRRATSPASSSSVSMSSSAEAVIRVAPARSPGCSRVMSDCLASTVTAAPSAAGPGGSAAATSSRSASRSCRTQCCGPGSSGASQRPIAPVPQPRSWITRRPVAGSCRARRSTRSRARAAASAGSRRASHSRLTRMPSAVIATPRPGRRRSTDAVVDHPGSDSRRSRAARRNRALSSASPSQARSAAPSAAGSSGGTSSPGRIPSAP